LVPASVKCIIAVSTASSATVEAILSMMGRSMAALLGQFSSSYPAGTTGRRRSRTLTAAASPTTATNASRVAAAQSAATSPAVP
jgi:hypothetical protein